MEFTGERYVPSVRGEIFYEHVHRYAIAANACRGKRVLDLASGEGWGAALLARDAADVIGIDIDAGSIEHARRKYYVANLRFITAPATELPLPEASIDVITCFETIEHVADQERMLDELRRVLVPGGTLFISSPNKLVYSDQSDYENPFHVRELYYQEFRDLLKRRFANLAIYGQRFVTSSVLHPLAGARMDDAGWYAGDLSAVGDGLPTFDEPAYFLAVCSDGPLYDRVASGFVDPHDDLYSHLRREWAMLRDRLFSTDHALASSADRAVALSPTSPSSNQEYVASSMLPGSAGTADPQLIEAQRLHDEAVAQGELGNAARDAVIAERDATITDHESKAAESERSVAESTARLAASDAVIVEKDRIIAERDEAITTRDARIAELEALIAAHGGVIADRDAIIVSKETRIAELKRLVSERDAEISGHAAQIGDMNALLTKHQAMIAEWEQRISDHARTVAEHEMGLELRDAALASRDLALAQCDAEVAQYEGRVAELESRLALAEAAGDALRGMLNSRSWKVTQPLRQAAALLRLNRKS